MFGPSKTFRENVEMHGSHRDADFYELVDIIRAKIQVMFDLRGYDILFIPGSGSIGVEAVIHSLIHHIDVVGPEAMYTNRWRDAVKRHAAGGKTDLRPWRLYTQLETSTSELITGPVEIVDAISSFPFYTLPKKFKIMITAADEQLGSLPGMAIVAIHSDEWDNIDRRVRGFDYLNIRSYKNNIPVTYNRYIFDQLRYNLSYHRVQETKEQIRVVSHIIADAVGRTNIIGEQVCPVLNIKKTAIPRGLASSYNLYGVTSLENDTYRIYTYSEPMEKYEQFAEELKLAQNG